jgi:hypothetical protein
MFDWDTLVPGVWRLGRSTLAFRAPDCHDKDERSRGHAREALELVRREVAANRPAVLWGAYLPEFAIAVGADDDHFHVESLRRSIGQDQPPIAADQLVAPGGVYVLAFPTVMAMPQELADRDAIIGAIEAMSWRIMDPKYASSDAAYELWISELQTNQAEPMGLAYNAQCWADARRLAERFVDRLAGRIKVVASKLTAAHGHLARCADALERVAKLFPFPAPGKPMSADTRHSAIEALRTARTADIDALVALRETATAWPTQ